MPGAIRNHLLIIRHVFRMLLETSMQVTDMRDNVDNHFPIDNELEAQHTVRGRVLRAHVDDHLLGSQRSCKSRNGHRPCERLFHQYGTFIPL